MNLDVCECGTIYKRIVSHLCWFYSQLPLIDRCRMTHRGIIESIDNQEIITICVHLYAFIRISPPHDTSGDTSKNSNKDTLKKVD